MIDFKINNGVGIATIDQPKSKANILNAEFFESLNLLLDSVEKYEDLKGLVFISAKPSIFLAGADLVSMRAKLNDQNWLGEVVSLGQKTFNRIEQLKIPTVAAIHGACLGGGLELALACSHRIASSDKCTKIGLPEVMLGILPAWGGTTRLPKLIGLTKALPAILSGKAYAPQQARKMGIVSEVCYKENLKKSAIDLCSKKRTWNNPCRSLQWLIAPIVFYFARKTIMRQTRGNYPAPLKIIEVVKKGIFIDKNKSLDLERKAFLNLSQTKACKNLIRIFFLQEKAKKGASPTINTKPIESIAVIGAGTMGAGIAHWISSRGKNVLLKDISEEAVASGLKKIGKLFISAVLGYKMDRSTVRACLGKLATAKNNVPLDNRDLAIEAVVENFDLKTKVLAQTEESLPESSILATNTSALSITELGKKLKRPDKFIGIHFFNPVHKMKLVEIVVGKETSQETVSRTINFVQSIGKLPVVVKDSPGFLVNRILLPYLVEAIRLFLHGHSVRAIDNAMLKFGMPMGPLRLLDEIGLDVASHVALDLKKRLKDFKVPSGLDEILSTKALGKKTNGGFYLYDKGKSTGINPVFKKLQNKNPIPCDLAKQMVATMTEESRKCILEEIAETTDDIDFAMIMGTGWAPFRGGPITHARQWK